MSKHFGKTWWGEHWLRSLDNIDYDNRLPRGASYARNGYVKEVKINDEFWLLLDTDHWIKGTNIPGLLDALQQAQKSGFRFAMSNPCFELWLLLHHEEIPPGTSFGKCAEVGARLKAALNGYNKTNVKPAQFPREFIAVAIQRARSLEANPDAPGGYWPEKAGTRVYLLLESIMGKNLPA